MSQIRTAVNEEGWELPLDPPGEAPTVGGSLASAAVGPRFGHPRDVVLGLDMVMADGTKTKCGGRVIKNVTGYDLMKLYLGSYGSIGVIGSAWLRLVPLPESKATFKLPVHATKDGFKRVLSASRFTSVRAACVTPRQSILDESPDSDSIVLLLELSGDERAVDRESKELMETYDAERIDECVLKKVRENQWKGLGTSVALSAHLRVVPSRVWTSWSALHDLGFSCFAYPSRGDLFASLESDRLISNSEILNSIRAFTHDGQGSFVLERAPLGLKREFDVFGIDKGVSLLTSNLKETFDPRGILNCGRFAGSH